MLRRALPILLAAGLLAGCGDDGPDYKLTTPELLPGAVPIAPKGQKLVDVKPTAATVAKVRPTIVAWTNAVRSDEPFASAAFFDLPTVVSEPDLTLSVNTPGVAAAYTATLPCAPRLVKLRAVGRFVVGDFEQRAFADRACADPGATERIGFVFGNPDHPERFTELWRVPGSSKAETGPAKRPTDGIDVQAQQLEQLIVGS